MKLVPAFFLLLFSILHLIYVIAAPSVQKADLERVEARKAAAFSRFKKSKKWVPVLFRSTRRNELASHLWGYAKYVRIISQRLLESSKAGLEFRIVDLHKVLMSNCPCECDVRGKHSYRDSQSTGNLKNGGFGFEKLTMRKAVVVLQHVAMTRREDKVLRKWAVFQVTASAYEMVKQVAYGLVSRIQRMAVNAAPKTMIQSLKETGFHVPAASSYAEKMRMVLPPTIPQEPQSLLLQKPQEKDLLLSRYVPEPSAVPLVEHLPEACPEPVTEQAFKKTPQFHDIKVSASPETAGTILDHTNIYPVSVVTFGRTDAATI